MWVFPRRREREPHYEELHEVIRQKLIVMIKEDPEVQRLIAEAARIGSGRMR